MLIKSGVNLFEASWRNTFTEEFLAALVADDVNYDAAQCGPHRRHQRVKHESAPVLVNVAGHDCVHGETKKGTVEGGNRQYAPCAQRLEQCPQKCGVAGKDVLYRFQVPRLEVYAKAKVLEKDGGSYCFGKETRWLTRGSVSSSAQLPRRGYARVATLLVFCITAEQLQGVGN